MVTLEKFLNDKTLYYDKIDYDVISKSWDVLKEFINLPYVIHVVGTNGKGSTGRFLASLLVQSGKKTLHYSSPHIVKFNERIWIDGKDSSDTQLEFAHNKLQEILPKEYLDKLTYFEYTTLLALFLSNDYDYIVLEAGLGGEFDATNVVKNDLSVFTTMGLDHQNFLGDTIIDIASTKMRSCDNSFILANQRFDDVEVVKNDILKDKKQILLNDHDLTKEAKNLPQYLQNNLNVALSVLDYLGIDIKEYKLPTLFGRFQKIASNIIIDVGHNPLAARAIYEQLLKEDKKITLIYNSYEDKDYREVLTILKPLIKELQIIKVDDTRIVNQQLLEEVCLDLCLNIKNFDIMNMDSNNYYLVFGSFIVIEKFLEDFKKYEKR